MSVPQHPDVPRNTGKTYLTGQKLKAISFFVQVFYRTFAVKIQETMSTFYTVLASLAAPISGLIVYMIIESRRTAKKKATKAVDTMLDDVSYIQEMQHFSGKTGFELWQQYDILLAARPFYWELMVDYAAYMESADIENIDSLTVVDIPNEPATELAHVHLLNLNTGGNLEH